jgi:hypothetical protein
VRLEPPLEAVVHLGHSASLLAKLLQPAPHRPKAGLLKFKVGAAQQHRMGPQKLGRVAGGKS